MEKTDAELISNTLAGDIASFNQLIKRYQRPVYNLVYRMLGNAEDASDVTQEVFLRAFCKLNTFRQDAVFTAWLYRIASNMCVDHFRARKITVPIEVEEEKGREIPAKKEENPEYRAMQNTTGEVVRQAILDLPERYRDVVIMRHLQGMNIEEISNALQLPSGTVKTHLFRGREMLRSRLAPLLGMEI
jgi:RNA polymerase sigma-70 factor (ECF subfamily)